MGRIRWKVYFFFARLFHQKGFPLRFDSKICILVSGGESLSALSMILCASASSLLSTGAADAACHSAVNMKAIHHE